MEQAGSRCETHVYPGMTHGFFNNNPSLGLTMKETDRFLASLGWLKGEPAVETSEVLNEPAPSKANKVKGKEKAKAAIK
jgi:hypothetical protein